MLVLGLMSGTSADGVDAVLAQFKGCLKKPLWKLLNFHSIDYPEYLRKKILAVSQGLKLNSSDWLELSESITYLNAKAASECDPLGQAELIGCHGQTIWHRPPTNQRLGASLQLLQAPLLAHLTNKPVVYDFRAADLALNGEGAPLVPLADEALIGRSQGWRAILNLGGISNLTMIPPSMGPDASAEVFGWDCGPANTLIDLAIHKFSKGKLFFDENGLIAKSGQPDEKIIKKWLKEPFFNLNPPKSTGRDKYGLTDLKQRYFDMKALSSESQISTLTSFTAAIVSQDLLNLYNQKLIKPIELFLAGGGSNNPAIFEELVARCQGIRVSKVDEFGIHPLAREALAFALHAWWHVKKYPGNSPLVTGATRSAVLGVKVEPS